MRFFPSCRPGDLFGMVFKRDPFSKVVGDLQLLNLKVTEPLNHLVFCFSTIPCSKETTLGYRGHYRTNPNNALVLRKTPQIYHRFALFDPPVKRTTRSIGVKHSNFNTRKN